MTPIFRTLLSHWRAHKLQLAITIIGVALGVAVVTAMDLANASALASFRQSLRSITGRATHQIAPGEGDFSGGVPEGLFATVSRLDGVTAAAPVIETHGLILAQPGGAIGNTPAEERAATEGVSRGEQSYLVQILGIDPLSEEPFRDLSAAQVRAGGSELLDFLLKDNAIILPQKLAERLGAASGAPLTLIVSGRRHTLTLTGTYDADAGFARGSDDIAIMDIAAVQEKFGDPGKISAIDLILPEGTAGEKAFAEIEKLLAPGLLLQRPSQRGGRTEALLEAFQLNLTALSLLALVVGIFLIHNTLTVAVLQRTPVIGTLRCLGVSSRQMRRAVLLEALLLGAVGSLLGLLAGRALAEIFLQRVGGTVSDLYAHISALAVADDPRALLKGAALGILASLAGAWFPAREAAGVWPVTVLRRSRTESRAQRSWKWLALAGAIAFAVALMLSFAPGASPLPGLGAAFALALGGALCSPAATRAFSSAAVFPLRKLFGVMGMLAARGIGTNLSRTGLAVGSLGMALSMTIGVGLMVSSFRATLDQWMEQTLHADLYIRPAGPSLMRHRTFIPLETLDKIRARPDVDAIDTYRGRDVVLSNGALGLVVATDTRTTFAQGRSRFPFYAGEPSAAFAAVLNGDVLISESLARKQNLHVGGHVLLPTPHGEKSLRVAGVYYEYATDRGVITMDTATYKELFGDDRANSVSVYLKPGADMEAARQSLRSSIGAPGGLYIFSNRALRDEAFRVFDRTFAITGQLENLSLAVGLAGILSALLALLRERSADFALLRALGLPARGLSRLIVMEGMLLGLVAFGVSCVLGPALALLLINVINVRAFGWTIFFTMHADVFFRVGILALLMSALAGVYPSWRARTLSISASLREE